MKPAKKCDPSKFSKDIAIFNDGECSDEENESQCSTAASKNA